MLSADEALAWGLVNQVVDDAEVLAKAQALAAKFAAGPTESYAAVEAADGSRPTPASRRRWRSRAGRSPRRRRHPHGQEGVAAFLGKRKPNYG